MIDLRQASLEMTPIYTCLHAFKCDIKQAMFMEKIVTKMAFFFSAFIFPQIGIYD